MNKIKSFFSRFSRPRVVLSLRGIVFYGDEFLLIQRSDKNAIKHYKWELPGGKLDKRQDPLEAFNRELMEETGLEAKQISKFAYWNSYTAKYVKYNGLAFLQIIGEYKTETKDVTLSFEHQDYKWVTMSEALDMDLTQNSRKGLEAWRDRGLSV